MPVIQVIDLYINEFRGAYRLSGPVYCTILHMGVN